MAFQLLGQKLKQERTVKGYLGMRVTVFCHQQQFPLSLGSGQIYLPVLPGLEFLSPSGAENQESYIHALIFNFMCDDTETKIFQNFLRPQLLSEDSI